MSPTRPYLVLGLGLLAVSTGALFIRFAQAEGVPSLAIAAVRLSLSAVFLLPALGRQHRDTIKVLPRRTWLLVAVSGLFLALHFATWITSLQFTSVANSTVFVSSSPIFVALIARIPTARLHEPPGLLRFGAASPAMADILTGTTTE